MTAWCMNCKCGPTFKKVSVVAKKKKKEISVTLLSVYFGVVWVDIGQFCKSKFDSLIQMFQSHWWAGLVVLGRILMFV